MISNVTCLENWGFYLFSPEFDKESELRNKLGVLWICSLLDTLEAQSRWLPEMEVEAHSCGWPTLEHAARELAKFCAVVGEVIVLFSREEQIFLIEYRNQLVHSYLSGRHRADVSVKYYQQGKFLRRTLPAAEYRAIVRPFYEAGQLYNSVASIVSRVISRTTPLRYWGAIALMKDQKEEIYRILRAGGTINIRI